MARTKVDPMTKSNKKPVPRIPMSATGVASSMAYLPLMERFGWNAFDAGMRFRDAHMELRVLINLDTATGKTWMEAADLELVLDHMEASAGNPVPPITRWL